MKNSIAKRIISLVIAALRVFCIVPFASVNAKAASGIDDFVTRCYFVAF